MTLYFQMTGKTRKRKRSVRESSDISDKPLQNFPWLETNEPQVVSPQTEGEKEQVFDLPTLMGRV